MIRASFNWHDFYTANYRKTGGEEYNSPHHSQQGSNHGQCITFIYAWRLIDLLTSLVRACTVDVDHDEVVRTAQAHGSGDSSMYSSAHQYISKPENRVRREVPRIIVNLRLIHIPAT